MNVKINCLTLLTSILLLSSELRRRSDEKAIKISDRKRSHDNIEAYYCFLQKIFLRFSVRIKLFGSEATTATTTTRDQRRRTHQQQRRHQNWCQIF